MTSKPKLLMWSGVLVTLCVSAFVLALSQGSAGVTLNDVLAVLFSEAEPTAQTVVMELRIPRALAAFAVGGLLAIAGGLMQILVRNPLADPYILGVSAGAATAALCAIALGLSGIWIDGSAFVGAIFATLLVFALVQGQTDWSPTRLLLTGVVVAAGFGAIISLILALSPEVALRGMIFWLMGDFSGATGATKELWVLAIAVIVTVVLGRNLNVLARGQLQAQVVGVNVKPLQITVYILSSLLTALAVTKAGSIGFVGLIVPHLVRLSIGTDHRILFPASALLGGALLVIADTLARTVLAPRQLPVGALTAILGVPLFLYLISKHGKRV